MAEEKLVLPKLYRTCDMDMQRVADDDGIKRYDVSVSSEAEIERWFGTEVLVHDTKAVDMRRLRSGAPVLIEHDIRDQIGVVERAYLKDRKLRAVLRFSGNSRGQEVARDVEDGIRRNLSVGYITRKVEVEEDKNGTKKYRAVRWEPGEISVVSIPADITVGVGRAADAAHMYPVEVLPAEKEQVMGDQEKPAGTEPAVEVTVATQAALDGAEIRSMCEANGVPGEADKFIREGKSPADVGYALFKRFGKETKKAAINPPAAEHPKVDEVVDHVSGLSARDRKRYSYARALQVACGMLDKSTPFDGIEAAVHQHLLRNKPHFYQHRGGLFVPMDLRTTEQQWADREKRALDSKVATKGVELVFDVPGELIELLRARAAVIALGARSLTGLAGPVAFPKQTGAGTAYWVGENPGANVTASDAALGLVTLQPKTLQSTTSYSRQLLAQASVDVESLVRQDLAAIHALAVDRAAIHGQGAAGEPTGIYKAPDVQAKAMGGVPDFPKLVDMIGLVADKNATLGTLGWITTALMAAVLRRTPEHTTATMADWVWQGTLEVNGNGSIAGYRAIATNQVSKLMTGSDATGGTEHGIVFGNWADLLVGLFGSLELVVDPYALKKQGMIEVTSFQMADLILRHGESFAKSTGATTS